MTTQPSQSSADEACICNGSPSTQGPEEDCPQHGRPYSYWVEWSGVLAARLAAVEALADEWIASDDLTQWGNHARGFCGRELRALAAAEPAPVSGAGS